MSLLCFIAVIELLNSSIEALADAVTMEKNSLIKISKDISSGAVFLASMVSLLVGLIILGTKIIALF